MNIYDITFYLFVCVVAIQLVFYVSIFSKFAFAKPQSKAKVKLPVSVIICAKNEAENLQKFLPSIISQAYDDFEIVLINDASSDETLTVMKSFQKEHKNIKVVDVESVEVFWGNKKYALTLGIKASTHDYLLFTDADCQPLTNDWIAEMMSSFSEKKSIVIGYGAYKKQKLNFLNLAIRFETILTAIQYFSYAKLGMPYMAVGRNLAYKKDMFFKTNGFVSHMKVRSGDDDLFVNEVANKTNTAVCFSKNSFTISEPETTLKQWFYQKRRHVSTSNHYKTGHKIALGLFYISQLLFWVLSIFLLAQWFQWKFVLALMLLRIGIQYLILGISAKKLDDVKAIIFLPVLELFLILSQFFIFIANLSSKPKHWR